MTHTAPPTTARPLWWMLGAIVITMSLALNLGVRGSEMADSGWHVATPSTVLEGDRHADPTIRIAINQMLRQTQVPLLQSPSPAAQQREDEQPALRKGAQRPLSNDGWRPAGAEGRGERQEGRDSTDGLPTLNSQLSTLDDPPPQSSPAESGEQATRNLGPLMRSVGRPVESSPGEPVDAAPAAEPTGEGLGARGQGPGVGKQESGAGSQESGLRSHEAEGKRQEADEDRADSRLPNPGSSEPGTVEITDEEEMRGERQEGRDAEADLSTLNSRLSTLDSQLSTPADPLPPLSRNMRYLRNKIRRVLKGYYNKPLNSRDHDPWEMMHGMLAYGVHSRVRQGSPRGELITSVGWLCYNRPCKGLTLLDVTPQGELRAKYGVGLQGHMGQFLAMLAQCKVSPDYPIRVGKHEFTVRDLVEAEKATCYPKDELTFKLISLMHYLDSDAQWVNDQGMAWDIQKLIREELGQPIRGAACGGTHRLAGLSLAARVRVARGEPLDGEFARASAYVEKYHNYAFRLQNRDGSLSTEWFRGRGDEPDIDRRIKTTGHILEWLIYSLSDEELQNSRTVRAVSYLANLLYGNYDHDWEIGPRSHALHALVLYDERVFAPYDEQEAQEDVAGGASGRPTTSRSPSRYRRR